MALSHGELTETCCVCGKPALNMTHEPDGDGRRYCSATCVGQVHPLSLAQPDRIGSLFNVSWLFTVDETRHRLDGIGRTTLYEWVKPSPA